MFELESLIYAHPRHTFMMKLTSVNALIYKKLRTELHHVDMTVDCELYSLDADCPAQSACCGTVVRESMKGLKSD